MKIKVLLINENHFPFTFNDKTIREVYYKRDFFTNEMKTFHYLFNRRYTITTLEEHSIELNNKLSTSNHLHVEKIDYSLLLSTKTDSPISLPKTWYYLSTEFNKKDIENFYQSTSKTLFGINILYWNNLVPLLHEMENDHKEVSICIITFIKRVMNDSDSNSKESKNLQDDILLRFNCSLDIHGIDGDLSNSISYECIHKLIIDIQNEDNRFSKVKRYKEILNSKPVYSKDRMKKLHTLRNQ